MPSSLYAALIARLKTLGRLTVLDASGEALAQGLLAGPTLVKPNRAELEQLVGQSLVGLDEVAQAARSLLEHDIRRVVVSLGEQGALFVEREQVLQALPPTVKVESTVGAGDAMVAALVLAELRGLDLAATARLATAYSLARITRLDGQLPPPVGAGALQRAGAAHSAGTADRRGLVASAWGSRYVGSPELPAPHLARPDGPTTDEQGVPVRLAASRQRQEQ